MQLELLPKLDADQVERLLREPSADNRVETAAVVAGLLDSNSLATSERKLATEIISVLARDVSEKVRRTVCEAMKRSPYLPPKVARELAEDIDAIAVPLLAETEVLGEADLIELVRNGNLAKQVAIAGRPYVSKRLSGELANTGSSEVIATLLENPGAEIAEETYLDIVETLPDDPRIAQAIVQRIYLPLAVVHRLVAVVSNELRDRMVERLELPPELIESFLRPAREITVSETAHRERRIEEIEHLVETLYRDGALSPTLVLRCLMMGDLHFFEAAFARLAGVSLRNARLVLHEAEASGLTALYEKSGFPASLRLAFRIAVEQIYGYKNRISRGGAEMRHQDLIQQIIDRMVFAYRNIYPAELESIFAQLSRMFAPLNARGQKPQKTW